MIKTKVRNKNKHEETASPKRSNGRKMLYLIVPVIVILIGIIYFRKVGDRPGTDTAGTNVNPSKATADEFRPVDKWIQRAKAVDKLFHTVYTPCWEGAYGAIGDAYLFAVTKDAEILRFHTIENDMRKMCVGTWVDDRAWVCLAEYYWWHFTGRTDYSLIVDAKKRYDEARSEGRLSSHDGYWSWYNWPPRSGVRENIFTNSNMNQMVTVACFLYEATGDEKYLADALLVWNGDDKYPGVEKVLYKGKGKWEGKKGQAAFGKEVPWQGAGYCAIGAALFKTTQDPRYKKIVVETAKWIMDPLNGWIDPYDFYQIQMDGNGAFVNFLLDAFAIAPDELKDIPVKIERMLEHVWTNHHGAARVTLHRETDHGIRNGWNPYGGEEGYGVDEVGTVHAQGEAARAFGLFVYHLNSLHESGKDQNI